MKDTNSRTYNVIKNSSIAFVSQMIYIVVSFICRTIFTKLLGSEYLGVNGLFSNILTLLNFAELGIGSALVYRMYEPLKKGDKEEICLYLNLYKKIYRYIIAVILTVGTALIYFIPNIVQAPDVSENIRFLYLLYLMDTVISYVYVYKKSLLIADQKDYVVSIFTQLFNIVMNIVQIIFLVINRNFIVYCIIRSLCTLLNNIVCARYADRHYSFIKNDYKGEISKDKINGLKKDVKGLLLTNIAGTVFSGTDNIFISAFLGIKYVGILSNYTLLANTFNAVMSKVFYSITASLGNLIVDDDKDKVEITLKRMFFLNTAIYSWVCLGLFFLIQEFVTKIWFSNEYYLSQYVIFIVVLELYLRSIHYPVFITRNASGRFSEYKVIFALMSIVNIVLDFLLVKPLGIFGLYLATIICRSVTYYIDIYVVYKMEIKINPLEHYKDIFKWILFVMFIGLIIYFTLKWIDVIGFIGFIIKVIYISIIYLILLLIVFGRSSEFKYYVDLFNRLRSRKQ